MKFYGLRRKSTYEVLGVSCQSQEGDYSVSVSFEFETKSYECPLWLVRTKEMAEHARTSHPEWYNAGYETPENPFNSEIGRAHV